MVLSDTQKAGIMLTALGLLFTFFGVVTLFDRGLLAIGNLLYLTGVTMVIGTRKTVKFFFQKRKMKGTICFFLGILLVLIGWAFIGIFVEAFGFINLFGDFFPIVFQFARNLPIIGTILNLPVIKQVVDRIVSLGRLPV